MLNEFVEFISKLFRFFFGLSRECDKEIKSEILLTKTSVLITGITNT